MDIGLFTWGRIAIAHYQLPHILTLEIAQGVLHTYNDRRVSMNIVWHAVIN